jgi:prepilin-type N-terminal cleavage/methylation domain-containing protein
MKNKKGFTLIELLAVIVILAIILVIAVPQVLGVISQAKKGSLLSSAQMIASSIERQYLVSQTTSSPLATGSGACGDAALAGSFDFSSSNYSATNGCTYTLATDANGIPTATVTIIAAGKFNGLYACSVNKDSTDSAIKTTTCS